MSASDTGKRMRHRLEQAALYAGESSHGFRRGQMQALSAAGMPSADIGKKVQSNTAATWCFLAPATITAISQSEEAACIDVM